MEDLLSGWIGSCDALYHKAIRELNIDLLKYLIQGNYPIEFIDECFVAIIKKGNLELLQIFVLAGYIPNPSLGEYFLREALHADRLPMIKYLSENQIHLDYIIRYNPDNYCISTHLVNVFGYLLENNMIDQLSINSINELALVSDYLQLLKIVLKYNSDINLDLWLKKAVINNSFESIYFLISIGANPNFNNSELVKYAYTHNHDELLKLLLDNGADASNICLTDLPIVKLLYDHGGRIL